MYPVLPFGPFTVPTGPIVLLLATTLGLEFAGRYGRRLGLSVDDVWNTGLLTILAGLIVARLWNVIQFWPIYVAEPLLIVSIRPSGFVLLPGLIAGVITAFAYLLRRALAPAPMVAALAVGLTVALALWQAGQLLTGDLLGVQSTVPWAVNYYGELRHPVALYYAGGLLLLVGRLWSVADAQRPMRTVLYLLLGGGAIYLVTGAFEYNASAIGGFRTKQLMGLIVAFCAALVLAYRRRMVSVAKDYVQFTDK
jgi:phosphatidylglycerol:prolipoprotein diacylglycerol transferase